MGTPQRIHWSPTELAAMGSWMKQQGVSFNSKPLELQIAEAQAAVLPISRRREFKFYNTAEKALQRIAEVLKKHNATMPTASAPLVQPPPVAATVTPRVTVKMTRNEANVVFGPQLAAGIYLLEIEK